jgi:CHAT domain-containing protein
MTDASPRHPEVEIMTAFIDGKLAPHEIAEVAAHLRECAECRTVVTETARLEREVQREEQRAARPRATPWWWLAAAAILALAAVTLPLLRWMERRPSAQIAKMIDLAPRQHRAVEPRLAGFPWARLQAPSRGTSIPDPADLKLMGAAGEVLEQTANGRTSQSRHCRGVAYLLTDRGPESIAALEQAARDSKDARVWNDLAAARYAMTEKHPAQLPLALADADRALWLDPKLAEAHFNRALVLERLGLREQARQQWQRYLELDPGGAWSVEARERLRRLSGNAAKFDRKLFDSLPPDTLVRRFPQDARTWGEALLLAEWADAEAKHDTAGAQEKLALVRGLGSALAAFHGEHLLADTVAAIDRADSTSRDTLAGAHRLYRDARLAYNRHDAGLAEGQFRRAAAEFGRGGSPMADVAKYYAASAAFDQHRGTEAHDELTRLLGVIDRKRHRALGAQIQWELAVVENTGGDYGSGARSAEAAAATFRALGERFNAAFADGIAAHSFDMIGASDLAWSRRARIFPTLSANRAILGAALHSAAMTAGALDHTDAAAALLAVSIEEVRDHPAQLAAALSSRAQLAGRDGDVAAGAQTVQEARAAANRVTDAALRAMLVARIDLADAALRGVREPHAALAALDRSIALFAAGNLGNLLPDAYLQRAQTFAAAGNDTAAAADYAAALREVEKQRETIRDAELRLRFLDVASQIVEGSIELELARGNAAEAFAAADRAHTLLDATPLPGAFIRPQVEHGVAVIEYAVLRHSIAIFCVTSDGIRARKVAVDRGRLAESVASFAEKIRGRAPAGEVERDGAALYRLLIAPLLPQLAAYEEIVIIPDRELHGVAFAALYDSARGRYLAEELIIRLAPAATASPAAGESAFRPALVVADPPTAHWPPLPASRAEAERIAAAYGATLLSGEEATRARFLEAAKDSALIHFAGHADSDAGESYAALLFAATAGDSGILGAGEIGQLVLARRPLVILAACGTFRGSTRHVAGMPSLARAFLLAGARGVIGTLWEVDDDVAAALFLRVHEHLRTGVSPARAVRAAQLEMIHASDARLQHPATWAPVAMLSNVS